MRQEIKLEEIIKPIVQSFNEEFIGLQMQTENGNVLAVYLGNNASINSCSKISKQISAVLDVENIISFASYRLEVTSAGIDRPLFSLDNFQNNLNQTIKITYKQDSQKIKQKGILKKAIKPDLVVIEIKNTLYEIKLSNIIRANLVTDIKDLLKNKKRETKDE